MAYIVQKNVVFYACTCGILKSISKLYFCRHCLQMRCGFCVCHEVDSHFCGKCAENIPSSEARLKKNRCSNCYDCPCCQHQLSIRVSSVNSSKNGSSTPTLSLTDGKATPEGKTPSTALSLTEGQATREVKTASRKFYYLSCSFCRWNTRDVGIPDKSSASGSWPERENVHSNRLSLIQEKYKAVVLWDKQQKLDKEKKKHIQRGKYITMTDKMGITAAMVRKRAGLRELPVTPPKHSIKEIASAVAHENVEGLPEDIFKTPLNLDEISTLEQRLLQPEWQPEKVNLLFPIHKHLSVKRSLRCRTCEHNVSKPEYNPNSIKFKIQLFAYYHIPEIRIVTVEPLRAGQISELIIKVCNPTQHQTSVTFLPITSEDLIVKNESDDADTKATELTSDAGETSGPPSGPVSSILHTSLTRQPSMTVEPRTIPASISGDVSLPDPSATVLLPPRDDTAEYDDSADTHNFQDDPKLVIWRKSNKVALKLKVTPFESLNIGETVLIGFKMKHVYVNTIAAIENKEPQKCDHFVKVFLDLGKTVGSD